MSQWGAYGMALQGWTYDKILTFYYTGVNIGEYKEPEKITVPDKAQNYPPQAKERGYLTVDEYLGGMGEVPNSWPKEAVKAQIVAARTYLMGSCGNKNECQICGTASCQVYNGVTSADPTGLGKQSLVLETKNKVILYNGAPIVAYYSASHRGYSSSISTVWGGTDLPYIQPVNDDAFAYKDYKTPNPYNTSQMIATYNWQWHTNGYTPEQLTTIFSKNTRTDVGNFQKIDIQKDVANRVSKITITGDKGSKSLTGWDFRAIFNASTPFNDYVYSTEFNFYQK
jgi:SpoIID/LytB domain protein